jgi:hypothetical protein
MNETNSIKGNIRNNPSKKMDVFSAEKYGKTRRKVKGFQHCKHHFLLGYEKYIKI